MEVKDFNKVNLSVAYKGYPKCLVTYMNNSFPVDTGNF